MNNFTWSRRAISDYLSLIRISDGLGDFVNRDKYIYVYYINDRYVIGNFVAICDTALDTIKYLNNLPSDRKINLKYFTILWSIADGVDYN